MLDAVRAEALKLRRHRATWMMVWIYPILITVVVIGMLIYDALHTPGAAEAAKPAAKWIRDSTTLWAFPTSAPGRFLIAGFAAVVFAGEYGWNTWKLIIPARSRWQLIAAKWLVSFGLVVLALMLADLIGSLGDWLETFFGVKIPEGVTLDAVVDAHLRAGAFALVPIAYTLVLAGMFAILTQSILATMILSIAVVVVTGMVPLIGPFAYHYLPGLTTLVLNTTPLFNDPNLGAWGKGAGLTLPLAPGVNISASLATSLSIMLAWIAAAAAVTQFRFLRQDLN
jgi:ABC-2 type transport system permease protein